MHPLGRVSRWLLGGLAAHPGKLVGLLTATGGAAHLVRWTQATGAAWPTAFSAGSLPAALGPLAAYTVAHPAYLAALLCGLVLVVLGE